MRIWQKSAGTYRPFLDQSPEMSTFSPLIRESITEERMIQLCNIYELESRGNSFEEKKEIVGEIRRNSSGELKETVQESRRKQFLREGENSSWDKEKTVGKSKGKQFLGMKETVLGTRRKQSGRG